MVKVDLHVHTNKSYDSFIPVKKAIETAKKRGLDGIAITDHNTFSAIKTAKKIAKKENFLLIPGEEITSSDGHIIALGIKRKIKRGMTAEKTISKIHQQKGVAIAAHPYGFLFHHNCVKDLIKELNFDAIEVFNSSNVVENKKAIKVARELDIPETAGSDSHFLSEIGRAYTIAHCKPTVNEFIEEIKKGNILWVGNKTGLIREALYYMKFFYAFLKKEKSLKER